LLIAEQRLYRREALLRGTWDNDEELASFIFLLEGPESLDVHDFDRLDLRGVVEGGARREVVNNLDVEDMLVGLLGAQVHVALWRETVEGVEVEYNSAKAELSHLARLRYTFDLWVLYLVSNKELNFVVLQLARAHRQGQSEFTTFLYAVEEPKTRKAKDHRVAANSIAILQCVLVTLILDLELRPLHFSKNEDVGGFRFCSASRDLSVAWYSDFGNNLP